MSGCYDWLHRSRGDDPAKRYLSAKERRKLLETLPFPERTRRASPEDANEGVHDAAEAAPERTPEPSLPAQAESSPLFEGASRRTYSPSPAESHFQTSKLLDEDCKIVARSGSVRGCKMHDRLFAQSDGTEFRHHMLAEAFEHKSGLAAAEQVELELMELRKNQMRLSQAMESLRNDNVNLHLLNSELEHENCQLKTEVQRLKETTATTAGSENFLRYALTAGQCVSAEDLRNAVDSTSALLQEAKRELAARELRARRAAYERLNAAYQSLDADEKEEEELLSAIREAQRTGVDEADTQKALAKVIAMQALHKEERERQRQLRAAVESKKCAFCHVKRDEKDELLSLLEGLSEDVDWKSWKDHAGRSLLAFAQVQNSKRVIKCLEILTGVVAEGDEQEQFIGGAADVEDRAHIQDTAPTSRLDPGYRESSTRCSNLTTTMSAFSPVARNASKISLPERSANAESAQVSSDLAPQEEFKPSSPPSRETVLRIAAFRAAVQNDECGLLKVINELPKVVWMAWRNKAGKDLITLSQERGSGIAYAVLARASGLLQERRHCILEEGDAVWVHVAGVLQPRRATALETVCEDDVDVLVEFWDGSEAPTRVAHSILSKAMS